MGIEIRRVTPQETDLIRKLAELHLQAPTSWDPQWQVPSDWADAYERTFAASAASETHRLLVAEDDGRFLGFCWAFVRDGAEGPASEVHEGSVWTEPEERGKGVAGHLMQAVEDWASEIGIHAVTSEVYSNNVTMLALSQKAGYQQESVNLRKRV